MLVLVPKDSGASPRVQLRSDFHLSQRFPLDADNRWRVDGLGRGAWDCWLLSRRHEPVRVEIVCDDSSPSREIERVIELRERPLRSRPVTGRVLDPDGRPVPDAHVNLTDDLLDWHTRADENGAFELRDLPLVPLRLSAFATIGGRPLNTKSRLEPLDAGEGLVLTLR